MPSVIFRHEKVNNGRPLVVNTGADEVAWAYVLNTAKYPTYGGEVIQILSCYVDDMQIQGTVRTYKEAEDIYEFFISYYVIASQGSGGTSFEQRPMIMEYPERQWTFFIQPLGTPTFTYSLETIAPKW